MLQIAYSSRKKTFLNTAPFISLQYPVNAIFQLPFKSNSEVLDSPPLFLCTINYVSYWVSVSTRFFPVYFVIALRFGKIKLLTVYLNIHQTDPFKIQGYSSAQFQRRYSRCKLILIHFHVNLRNKKSDRNVSLI